MHIIPIFSNFDIFWHNLGLILGCPYFFFLFFSIDNNWSCVLYSRIPSFHIFLGIFLCQNAHKTNFFTNFCHFWQISAQFWPNFGVSLFFSNLFQLIITYHFIFILDYPHFIILYVFFLFRNTHNTNFLPIFANFDKFWPNFGLILGRPYFFSFFFNW